MWCRYDVWYLDHRTKFARKVSLMRLHFTTIKDLPYNEEPELTWSRKTSIFLLSPHRPIILLLQCPGPRWTQRISLILLYTRGSFLWASSFSSYPRCSWAIEWEVRPGSVTLSVKELNVLTNGTSAGSIALLVRINSRNIQYGVKVAYRF